MTLPKKIDHEFMGTFDFEILAILRGETAPNGPIFFNWLKTRTKVINALENGHFWQKCPFKMALRTPKLKNGDHFLMPTSPQNGN